MNRIYYVYILASRSRNLYTGVTNNLGRRLVEHREGRVPGFTSRYKIFRLVHYEVFRDIRAAIRREKEIKSWRRDKKEWLIKRHNPTWEDLAEGWFRNAHEQTAKRAAPENAKGAEKADPSPPSRNRPGSG